MKRVWSLGLIALAASTAISPAEAGTYGDRLRTCLLSSATQGDRALLGRWMFSTVSANPDVQDLSKLTPDQRKALERQVGALFTRLMMGNCRAQMVAALKNEGPAALQSGVTAFGEVAMRELIDRPEVMTALSAAAENMDQAKLDSIIREAGMTPPAAKADSQGK